MNGNPQPRPLFPTDVVMWPAEAHRIGGGVWREGKAIGAGASNVIVEAEFRSVRVITRATVRHMCRETILAMMTRVAQGVPARSRRRHGRSSMTRFQRRWAQARFAAHGQVVKAAAR